jgi:hypothetical protein
MLRHRNKVHNLKLLSGAGGQPTGLAKMRRRFLRGSSRHFLYRVDGSHFAMCLQVLAQRAGVPLRRQGDGWRELPFPADFGVAHRSAPRLQVELLYAIFGIRQVAEKVAFRCSGYFFPYRFGALPRKIADFSGASLLSRYLRKNLIRAQSHCRSFSATC